MGRYDTRLGSCTTGASFFSQRTVGVGLPDTRQKSSAMWPRDVVMLFMGASRRMKREPGGGERRGGQFSEERNKSQVLWAECKFRSNMIEDERKLRTWLHQTTPTERSYGQIKVLKQLVFVRHTRSESGLAASLAVVTAVTPHFICHHGNTESHRGFHILPLCLQATSPVLWVKTVKRRKQQACGRQKTLRISTVPMGSGEV